MKKVCDERSFTRLDWVLKIQLRYEFMYLSFATHLILDGVDWCQGYSYRCDLAGQARQHFSNSGMGYNRESVRTQSSSQATR